MKKYEFTGETRKAGNITVKKIRAARDFAGIKKGDCGGWIEKEGWTMRKAIAIDFDGCLCENAWPEIGSPHWDVIHAAQFAQRQGAALILWTCRSGELLEAAIVWCRKHGVIFDAINENLPERLEHYGCESRKVSADEYWDDNAVRKPDPLNDPLTLEELREMDGEPVLIIPTRGSGGFCTWMLVDTKYDLCREVHGEMAVFENCGKTWLAYRRKPEGTA